MITKMFCKTLLVGAFAALAAAQSAVLTFTNVPNPITDGEAQAILYSTNDSESPVTIVLRQGPSNNLQTVETLTTDSVGGQFIWTPPKSLPNGNNYALEIRQNGQNNYFGPFVIQGASPSAVSSASAAPSSSASDVSGIMSILPVATANSTMTAMSNSTMVATGMTSAGTGTTMSRNMTMSAPTLSSTRTAMSSPTDDAGFQGSETSSVSGPQQTDNAAVQGKSSLAFAVGALAAVLYLH